MHRAVAWTGLKSVWDVDIVLIPSVRCAPLWLDGGNVVRRHVMGLLERLSGLGLYVCLMSHPESSGGTFPTGNRLPAFQICAGLVRVSAAKLVIFLFCAKSFYNFAGMLVLYRIYQVLIMCPLVVAATIVVAVATVAGSALGYGRWWGYYPEIYWARLFCWLNFVTVSVRGRENIDSGTSYVFVANHQGAFDIFSLFGWLGHNFRWMMKESLRRIPFVGWACKACGQIFVDSSSVAATRRTMEAAEAQLRGGMSLAVFPEGARTWDGRMRRFKRGAFRLAVEFGLPVVPVTIDGAFDVLPRFRFLPRPGHISLTIHEPILPPVGGHDVEVLMEESRHAIESGF